MPKAKGARRKLVAVLFLPDRAIMPAGVRKNHLKLKRASRDPCCKLTEDEIRLTLIWFSEGGMEPSEVAGFLRRDKSTLTPPLVMSKER